MLNRLQPDALNAVPMKKRQIYFLIVNYYCSHLLFGLIKTIFRSEAVHIIIVDNSPHDPGVSIFSIYDRITILSPEENLGFGGGCNIGLRYIAKIDPDAIVWLLNPDTELKAHAVDKIRYIFENQRPCPAILGTSIADLDGRPWMNHGRFNRWTGSFSDIDSQFLQSDNSDGHTMLIRPVDWVSGCSMLLNLDLFNRVPQFDEHIFLYYEDAELCLRMRKLGFNTYITTEYLVQHSISAVTSRQPYLAKRCSTFGKLYTLFKHATVVALLINILYIPLAPIFRRSDGRAQAQASIRGLYDFTLWLLCQSRHLGKDFSKGLEKPVIPSI